MGSQPAGVYVFAVLLYIFPVRFSVGSVEARSESRICWCTPFVARLLPQGCIVCRSVRDSLEPVVSSLLFAQRRWHPRLAYVSRIVEGTGTDFCGSICIKFFAIGCCAEQRVAAPSRMAVRNSCSKLRRLSSRFGLILLTGPD